MNIESGTLKILLKILKTEISLHPIVRKVCRTSQVAYQTEAYSRFQKREVTRSVSAVPLDGMLVHHRVTPSIKFAGTHLYTWEERGIARVKGLSQKHSTTTLARARTCTVRVDPESSTLTMRPLLPSS